MEDITNKATKIVFLNFPCIVVVCESCETPGYIDPETNGIREYARIRRYSSETEHYPMLDYVAAGEIWFSKHATMLTDEQREQIKAHAAKLAGLCSHSLKTAFSQKGMKTDSTILRLSVSAMQRTPSIMRWTNALLASI